VLSLLPGTQNQNRKTTFGNGARDAIVGLTYGSVNVVQASPEGVQLNVRIRPAIPEDAAALAVLSGELGYPSTQEQILGRLTPLHSSGHDAILVAVEQQIIGWIHVARTLSLESGSGAEIMGLVVAERFRGGGIGAMLVSEAEQWARGQGLNRIRVRTNVVRGDARAFYAKRGYRLVKQQAIFDKNLASSE